MDGGLHGQLLDWDQPDEVMALVRDAGSARVEILAFTHRILYRLAGSLDRKDGERWTFL